MARDAQRDVPQLVLGFDDRSAEQRSAAVDSDAEISYLLFSDDEELSLDDWVFNRSGHPFQNDCHVE